MIIIIIALYFWFLGIILYLDYTITYIIFMCFLY